MVEGKGFTFLRPLSSRHLKSISANRGKMRQGVRQDAPMRTTTLVRLYLPLYPTLRDSPKDLQKSTPANRKT
jgi:hypothetical protein